MLDLENDCTATLALYQSSDCISNGGPINSLDNIAKFFQPALPTLFQNTSALELCNYWNVIQMTDFQHTAVSAWYHCSSAAPEALNISDFNFTQDCNATVSYWDQVLNPSSFVYGNSWFGTSRIFYKLVYFLNT
jgi:hypothetical protein